MDFVPSFCPKFSKLKDLEICLHPDWFSFLTTLTPVFIPFYSLIEVRRKLSKPFHQTLHSTGVKWAILQ